MASADGSAPDPGRLNYLISVQVLGNGKGVVAVIVSVLWFQNPVSIYGLAGYGVTLSGVIAYSQVRASQATTSTTAWAGS